LKIKKCEYTGATAPMCSLVIRIRILVISTWITLFVALMSQVKKQVVVVGGSSIEINQQAQLNYD